MHENVVDYAERLVGLHHDGIESMIMACSGTEATELALRMAQDVTGRRGLICTDATYHGNVGLVGRMRRLDAGGARGEVKAIHTPQMFRPLEPGLSEEELCQRHLDELAATIASFDDEGGFAGIMLCTILANEGLPDVPGDWLAQAVDMVHDAGGVVIGDEVQAGFGRSGKMWGYETMAFVPDIVCMGKPMGNGMPVSAVASSHDNITAFRKQNFYFNTYASSPLQAAAGNAVLDEIEDRKLVAQVAEVGEYVRAKLGTLQADHPAMGDVRGCGMFIGIDWVVPGTTEPDVAGAAAIVETMKDRGMLLGRAGQHFNVLKVRPPLVFTLEHADLFLAALTDAVADAGD